LDLVDNGTKSFIGLFETTNSLSPDSFYVLMMSQSKKNFHLKLKKTLYRWKDIKKLENVYK